MANFDTLKAVIAAKIHDNTEQEITADDVRDSFNATIDAINAAKEDEGAIAPAVWGGITGTLSDQTDLQDALDSKYEKPSGGIPGTDLTAGVRSDLNKARSAVQPGDLALVASTGSYNDLLNKPSIPAAQVQSDWNESDSTKPSFIKNKPVIPSGGGDVTDVTLGGSSVVDGNGVAVLPPYPTVGNPLDGVGAPTPYDGTIIFTHRNGDTDTVDLNHTHPQYEEKANKVTSLSALSTNDQYPSAKCVYDIIGDVETLLAAL